MVADASGWVGTAVWCAFAMAAGRFAMRQFRVARNLKRPLIERANASIRTFVVAAGIAMAGSVTAGLFVGEAGHLAQGLLAWVLLGCLACIGYYVVVASLAKKAPDALRERDAFKSGARRLRMRGGAVSAGVVQAFEVVNSRSGLAPLSFRRTVASVMGLLIAVLLGGFLVETYSGSATVLQLGREYAFLVASVVLLSCTLPVMVTWAVLAVLSGRPEIGLSLKGASDAVGVGLVIGLLCGVTGFWLNMLQSGRPLQDPSMFSFDTVIGTSLFGSIVGFGVAHIQILLRSARTAARRLVGYAVAAGVSIGSAVLFTSWASPRQVASKLLDAVTDGVAYPTMNADSVANTDWRATFLVAHDQILATLPNRGIFLACFAGVVVTVLGVAFITDVVKAYRQFGGENAVPSEQLSTESREAPRALSRSAATRS